MECFLLFERRENGVSIKKSPSDDGEHGSDQPVDCGAIKRAQKMSQEAFDSKSFICLRQADEESCLS